MRDCRYGAAVIGLGIFGLPAAVPIDLFFITMTGNRGKDIAPGKPIPETMLLGWAIMIMAMMIGLIFSGPTLDITVWPEFTAVVPHRLGRRVVNDIRAASRRGRELVYGINEADPRPSSFPTDLRGRAGPVRR
ncbi:hypothetical protein [Microvirga makkahensis]|uniref:Uncharacterized protein n=1 Tax=Microvirga makkahensis TaxID=1128670 RepID=A0A7X3MWF6_9HYPH|nr:hypothetical protein [Microvirga makkahensis]MXQ14516.1 hypothetical protein [Microvirga makkahensis]